VRVFIDSNVLVSSFTSNGLSRKLIDILTDEHEIIISPQVLEESSRVIMDKFDVEQSDLDAFLDAITTVAEISLPPYPNRPVIRDPDDIDILAAALKSKADYLVTGDKDLLSVDTEEVIAIVKPRTLFDLLNEEGR
jgi:putative PIN family toxin of toxin-antitoxin system